MESRETMITKLEQVAERLPLVRWERNQYPNSWQLGRLKFLTASPNIPQAQIVVAEERGRLRFYGCYPQDPEGAAMSAQSWGAIPYDAKAPEISVTPTKTPDQIAKDLERRFIPQYHAIFNDCLDKYRKACRELKERKALQASLCKILGDEFDPKEQRAIYFPRGKAEVRGHDSVSFKIDLNQMQAIQLAQAIANLPMEEI